MRGQVNSVRVYLCCLNLNEGRQGACDVTGQVNIERAYLCCRILNEGHVRGHVNSVRVYMDLYCLAL